MSNSFMKDRAFLTCLSLWMALFVELEVGAEPVPSLNARPKARFEPPAGRVVHGMGQWEVYNTKLLPALPVAVRPLAQLLFIDIGDTRRGWRPQGGAARLQALGRDGFVPVLDIGLRGNQPTKAELDQRPDKLFGIDNEVASSARFDSRLEDLAKAIREFGQPVLVRIGGEFNGWWNGYHPYAYDWTRSSYFAQTSWKNNDFTANQTLLDRLIEELKKPRYLHASEKEKLAGYQTTTPASMRSANSAAAPSDPPSNRGGEALKSDLPSPRSEVEQSRLTSAATTRSGSEKRAELAKWDDAAEQRSKTGPGGTEWDAQYRSFIQTDENAMSKTYPTHAEAAKLILADAAKNPDNLRRHLGWVLFIKHFSQAYRPESATADLKRLYEDLVTVQFGGTARTETPLFDGDARLTIHRDVVYGKTHPEVQKLDAYLVKSNQPTPVLLEFHGGGWRRGSKSQFLYQGDLIRKILDAGISVVAVDYRLTPQHAMPAQTDDAARAVQFVRSKAKEWNLDPERIMAMGGSAGAHLSAWVALHDDLARPDSPDPVERQSTRLRGFVDLWGPMDLTRVRPTELAKAGLRGADFADAFTAAFACSAEAFEQDSKVRQRVREASPLFLVTRDDPPALIVHSAGEDMAPGKHPPIPKTVNDPHSAWHGVLLADAMREAGIEVVCRIGPQVGKDPAADNETIVRFLQGCLGLEKNPPEPRR